MKERKAMQEAVPVGEGSMLAVLGVKIDDVQNYLSKLSKNKICEIANDNADGQIILSGKKRCSRRIKRYFKD